MIDLRKFKFISDYPMPHIVYKQSVEFVVSGSAGFLDTSISHGLPFTPLLIGQWSTNPNFSPSYDINIEVPNFTASQPVIALKCGADTSKIYISMTNNTGSNQTFYFRLLAFMPPDYTGDISNIYDDSTNFKFSSEFNYQKIFMADKLTVANATIAHGLGYIPQARVWDTSILQYAGDQVDALMPARCQKNINTGSGDVYVGPRLTTNELILSNIGTPAYYHIYGDEA